MRPWDGDARPLLVLVSGCPGSGKTTLARLLGEELRIPVVSRDRVRDGIWATGDVWQPGGVPRRFTAPAAASSFAAFYGVLALLLSNGVSAIGEATFLDGVSDAELHELAPKGTTVIVHCQADTAKERFLRRTGADPVYADLDEAELARLFDDHFPRAKNPPSIRGVPSVMVDTDDGYQPGLREVAGRAWSNWESAVRPTPS